MPKFVRESGARASALAAGVGLIALAGTGVAATLTACEVSSCASARSTIASARARADLPEVPLVAPAHARAPAAPEMRVRIFTAVDSVQISGPGGVLIGQGDPRGRTALPIGAKAEKRTGQLSVVLKEGLWVVGE